jgi:manganese-dependent inorganic pyrophosphatase
MSPIVVTSYTEPDLDGFACSVAYAEFLNKTGTPAVVRFFGEPHVEAKYLVKKFDLKIEETTSVSLDKVALVDASELRNLDKFIKPENVIEIIDHRKVNDAALFKNARLQIEFVGSAATLITEKFYEKGMDVSTPAATLLYGAIVSNTLNFRANVTTDRDRRMAEWLNKKFGFTQVFIDDMFRAKSDVSGKKLTERIDADFAWFQFGEKKIGCAQLEIMDGNAVVLARHKEILGILEKLKANDRLDDIFLSLIDLGGGFNIFIAESSAMQSALSDVLNIKFDDTVAVRSGFIMRKEIAPLLKAKLE